MDTKRIYTEVIYQHFKDNPDKMLFLSGPRQVGKTSIAKSLEKKNKNNFYYFNWDNFDHKQLILEGPSAIAKFAKLDQLNNKTTLIIFDEIYKFSKWKIFLKGFYDTYKDTAQIVVTGSSHLNVYKKGGDSLMGRYFLYNIHPFSLRETTAPKIITEKLYNSPLKISDKKFSNLFEFGGFPEPFLKANKRFQNQWKSLKHEQLFRDDIRDLTKVQEINQMEVLANLLVSYSGNMTKYSNLAKHIKVNIETISRWIEILESLYFCFRIRPYSKNVKRSLLKEPKIYLYDHSQITDEGQKIENFVACHLYKYVHFLTDYGWGNFELFYLRDKEKNEVDFLITKDDQPWIMLEVKKSHNQDLSKSLQYFQNQLNAKHVLQLAFDMPYIDQNCFLLKTPKIVPVKTFLSQLV